MLQEKLIIRARNKFMTEISELLVFEVSQLEDWSFGLLSPVTKTRQKRVMSITDLLHMVIVSLRTAERY